MPTVGVDGTMHNNPGALRTWHCSRSKKMDPPMVSVLPISWCRWGEANAQQLGRARNLALLAIQENGSASTSTQTTTTTHPPHNTSATKSACGTSKRTSATHPEHHTRCVHVAHTYEHRSARVDNHADRQRWCVWCCQARSELGTARDPRKTDPLRLRPRRPPQHIHQKRLWHIKVHIRSAHLDRTPKRTPNRTSNRTSQPHMTALKAAHQRKQPI